MLYTYVVRTYKTYIHLLQNKLNNKNRTQLAHIKLFIRRNERKIFTFTLYTYTYPEFYIILFEYLKKVASLQNQAEKPENFHFLIHFSSAAPGRSSRLLFSFHYSAYLDLIKCDILLRSVAFCFKRKNGGNCTMLCFFFMERAEWD